MAKGRIQKRRKKLEECKNHLEIINELIPWDIFRRSLEQLHPRSRKSNAGRKPIDLLILFKLLILQQLYNLSDQTHDRISFRKFVGLEVDAEVPDAKTM